MKKTTLLSCMLLLMAACNNSINLSDETIKGLWYDMNRPVFVYNFDEGHKLNIEPVGPGQSINDPSSPHYIIGFDYRIINNTLQLSAVYSPIVEGVYDTMHISYNCAIHQDTTLIGDRRIELNLQYSDMVEDYKFHNGWVPASNIILIPFQNRQL